MVNASNIEVGEKYKWKHQEERLIYLGKQGLWHQFALVEELNNVWSEVLDDELRFFETVSND